MDIQPIDWIVQLVSGQPWTYPLVMGVALFEAVVPIMPAETVLVTAAVASSDGNLSPLLIAASAAVGCIGGDNLSYWIGRRYGQRAYFAIARGDSAQKRYEWAEGVLSRYGAWILPAARFVPAGRTVITLASGGVRVDWHRYLIWDTIAGVVWACLYTAIGYWGGEIFAENLWVGFAVALGIAGVISTMGMIYYRVERARA